VSIEICEILAEFQKIHKINTSWRNQLRTDDKKILEMLEIFIYFCYVHELIICQQSKTVI